jgi:DNA primase
MSLSPQFLDELRARTLLSALIGRTTKLQKAGREFRACCPFHNEKSPSFYVNDDKAFYHCFGCGAHGDAIRWMTDQRGLPFMDAVKELAQAAGMEMPAIDRQSVAAAERSKGLHEACADAASWFSGQLNGIAGSEARNLLEKRGIRPETAQAFGLGFSPDSRGKLKTALADYGDTTLIEAGLLISVEGKEPYDRFRGRLMIPIRDPRGRVIAFGGRIIGEGEPKYLNSPETPLFDKGRNLYNLDRAAPAARKAGRLLVVEGYMDVIALAQAGFGEAVAPLGTALTEAQLERLWRVSDTPILCFDGDQAGQKAAIRAAHKALPLLTPGHSLSFVTLPQGQDPDDVIASGGPAAFDALTKRTTSLAEQIWRAELAGVGEAGPDDRAALRHRLNVLAETIQNPLLQTEYKKTFNEAFYSAFGWKKQNIEAIRQAMATAPEGARRGLQYAFQRAVLLGLMRHPTVLMSHIEEIHRLHITDRRLREWRDHLIDAAIDNRNLTEGMINQILDEKSVTPIESRDLRRDLAFSFYRKSADPVDAIRDLGAVIDIMIEEREAKLAYRLAQQAFSEEMTDTLFVEQQAKRSAATAARKRLADLLIQARDALDAQAA